MFSRANADAGPKTELRGLAPTTLVTALDALALSEGQDRNGYVVKVLEVHVREQLRKASLLNRVLRGNPLLADADGVATE